jgi:hypothetical protein
MEAPEKCLLTAHFVIACVCHLDLLNMRLDIYFGLCFWLKMQPFSLLLCAIIVALSPPFAYKNHVPCQQLDIMIQEHSWGKNKR